MIDVAADAKELLTDLSLYKLPVNPLLICEKLGIEYDEKA